ncbi:uncharacterized protein ACN2A1_014761 [Glossina fuscipes fuscipes]
MKFQVIFFFLFAILAATQARPLECKSSKDNAFSEKSLHSMNEESGKQPNPDDNGSLYDSMNDESMNEQPNPDDNVSFDEYDETLLSEEYGSMSDYSRSDNECVCHGEKRN